MLSDRGSGFSSNSSKNKLISARFGSLLSGTPNSATPASMSRSPTTLTMDGNRLGSGGGPGNSLASLTGVEPSDFPEGDEITDCVYPISPSRPILSLYRLTQDGGP